MGRPTVADPLRILYVLPGRPEGNNMIFARATAAALRRKGIDVEEFYLHSRTHAARVLREYLRLRKRIREFDPTIVHAQYGGVNGLVAILAGLRRRKVLTVRGSDLNLAASLGWLRCRVVRLMTLAAALIADEVICVSQELQRQLSGVAGKRHVIPSGVDTDVFFPVERDAARAAANLPPGVPLVLFNAGQAPQLKGLPLVERAVEYLKSDVGDVMLHVTRGELSRDELAVLMNAADCLVVASEAEGSPNVVKEAMACNLPVVSVCVGDVQQRLAPVFPSRIVDRTPAALAEGIAQILRLGQRSNGSQEIRAQRLTQADVADSLHQLYVATSGQCRG